MGPLEGLSSTFGRGQGAGPGWKRSFSAAALVLAAVGLLGLALLAPDAGPPPLSRSSSPFAVRE